MRSRMSKLVALALCVAMALSLLCVPAAGAAPMMGETAAAEAVPEDVGAMPADPVSRPQVSEPETDGQTEAELLAGAASYAYNFDSAAGDSYVTITSGNNGSTAYTWNGITFEKGLKIESKTKVAFETTSAARVTLVLTGVGKNIVLDGATTAVTSEEMTFELAEGSHTISKASSSGTNIILYYLMWEPAVAPCEEHTWGEWSEDSASCTEPGTKTRVCTVCGASETVDTPALGHTPVTLERIEPTCVDYGREAGTVCSVCDAILTGGGDILPTGQHVDEDSDKLCDVCGKTLPAAHDHNYVTELKNTATCTAAGVKTLACDFEDCDATTTVEVEALGHDMQAVEAQAATCTAVGWSAHQACSRCGYKEGYVEIPALGHDFGEDGVCKHGCGTTLDTAGMNAGGWFETIYAEIEGVKDAQVTQVFYSGPVSGILEDDDFEYLVRDAQLSSGASGVRVDIPGLPAGTYSLVVTANGVPYTATGIQVMAYDRSGYAHYEYTDGVGAYRDDGILKDNAIVLYVTEENKNTVTVTSSDGTTVTGIGNILNTAGKDVGGGVTDKGGKANSNAGIMKKLAEDGTPLVVRIIGQVGDPDGTTAFDSTDYGGSVGDNGGMARMKDARNITIEGVGSDAVMDGWGIHFMAGSGYQEGGKSFEVRNISFQNVPEDCIGMEGVQSGSTLTASVERCWVHNCSFYAPTISNPAESDKDGGDGACDFKRGQYMTLSYCYFEGYHKTSLLGASDSNLQYHITWHHNWWKTCDSRGPLGRQANVHIYNCLYDGQTTYAQNTRANAYIFSEYNTFLNCKGPRRVDSGAIKSYNDALSSCINDSGATTVTDKTQKVSSGNKYENFDTDPDVSYIPSGDYKLDTDLAVAKANIMAYCGPMKAQIITPEDVNGSTVAEDRTPTDNVSLPYDKDINSTLVTASSGTFDNIVFTNVTANSSNVKYGKDSAGQYVVFKVGQAVDVTLDGTASVLVNEAGNAVADVPGSATNLPAGIYYVQPNNIQPAKNDSPMTYKEGTLTHLKIVATADTTPAHTHSWDSGTVTVAATCTREGVKLYTCSCGETYTESIAKIAHVYEDGACVSCGLQEGVYDPDATGGTDTPETVAVTGVSLSENAVSVDQGSTVTVTATVTPANATRKSVTWTSDNEAVATVANGVIRGVGPGAATVTATTKDGGFTATCAVTVIGVTEHKHQFDSTQYGSKSNDAAVSAEDLTAIAAKTDYFTLTKVAGTWKTTSSKVYLVLASQEGNAMAFTITQPTNTVTIAASSTGSSNWSAIALLDSEGARVADKDGKTIRAIQSTATTAITFENLPVGTYYIVAPANVTANEVDSGADISGLNGRGVGIHTVTVTETERADTTDYLDGATDLHYTVSNGAVTVTDTIPTGDLVLATYWKDGQFLGAKAATKGTPTVPISGWNSVKLFWIDQTAKPQSPAKTIH